MAQWIRDHRGNGSIITHEKNPSGGFDVGGKLNPVQWNGTTHESSPNHNGSTYGGRIFADHENQLPRIARGYWDSGGYFPQAGPGARYGRPLSEPTPVARSGRYYEFDVYPSPKWTGKDKADRGLDSGARPERIVVGDDGSMYYSDHYEGFQLIQGPKIPPPNPPPWAR